MKAIIIAAAIGLAVFGGVWLLTSGRPGSAPDVEAGPGYAQRDRGEGGVEIEVIYVTPEYLRAGGADARKFEPDRYAVFLVAMNTHTVDLSAYDMVKGSELKVGGKTVTPLKWESTSKDSHHRSGALIFPKVDPAQPAELTIKTIAGVAARVFRWAP